MSRGEMILVLVLAAAASAAGGWRIARRQGWGREPSVALRPQQGPIPKIDINAAPWWEIAWLPDIGEAKAKAIVAYRETHGPFHGIDELTRVPGIGRVTVDRLRDRVTLSQPHADQQRHPATHTPAER